MIRVRRPQVFDVLRIDGRLHIVRTISFPGWEVGVEPLGDTLARCLLVDDRGEAVRLGDALIEAGWLPPWQADEIRKLLA